MENKSSTSRQTPMERLKTDGVFVVTRLNPNQGVDTVLCVVMTLEAAAAAVVDDAEFWLNGEPVYVSEKEVWGRHFQWVDDNKNWASERFAQGVGRMRAEWGDTNDGWGWTEYIVQWTTLHITY